MKAQEDFRRCLLYRLRRHVTSPSSTPNSDDDVDPVEAERDAYWGEMLDPELRKSSTNTPSIDSDSNALNVINGTSLIRGDIPQSGTDEDKHVDNGEVVCGFTKFHRICCLPRKGPLDPKWQAVREYLRDRLSSEEDAHKQLMSTQKEGYDYNPLHIICFLSPPLDIVKQMVELCPDAAKMVTKHGDTCLGLACGGFVPAGDDVIEFLHNKFPDARDQINLRKESPLLIHLKIMMEYALDPCPIVVGMLATVETVNTRDAKGHSPLYYLGKAATEAFSFMSSCIRFFSSDDDSGPDFEAYERCLSSIVTLDPGRASKTLFLRDLLQFPVKLRDLSFEKQSTRDVINSIVGRGQYTALLMMDFYVQLVIVVSYALGCSNKFENKSYTTAMMFGSTYWLVKRFISALGSSEHWSKINHWNMMNVMQAILLMASSIHLRNNGLDLSQEGESGPWRNALIVTSVIIWLTMLGIVCHTLKGFSVFVQATVQIFKKLVNLFMVFVVIFMAFSSMLFLSAVDSAAYCVIDEETGEFAGDYCTLQDAFEKVYSLFFGTLEADDFDVPTPTLVTLFFFNIIVVILLLNIIIAVMSDCYVEVNANAELVFWDHRFELIQDVDAITNCVTTHFGSLFSNRDQHKKRVVDDDAEDDLQDLGDLGESLGKGWFGGIIHGKINTKIPQPLYKMYIAIVLQLWVLVGLLTFGLTWPKNARMKIFAPTTCDHLSEDEQPDIELERMKRRNETLERKNCELSKENEVLRRKLGLSSEL